MTVLQRRRTEVVKRCGMSATRAAEVSGVLDSPGAHAGPVPPIDVLLDLNPAKGQAKVMSGRCGAAGTPE